MPLHQYQIRPATQADAPQLAALAMHVWLHTYALEGIAREIADYVFAQLTPAAMAQTMAQAQQQTYLAEHSGNVIAYAMLKGDSLCPADASLCNELSTLYVQPHFAGRGLGKALLHTCEQAAGPLWLTCWHRNQQAHGFYLKQGMVKLGSTYFELGNERHENSIFSSRVAI